MSKGKESANLRKIKTMGMRDGEKLAGEMAVRVGWLSTREKADHKEGAFGPCGTTVNRNEGASSVELVHTVGAVELGREVGGGRKGRRKVQGSRWEWGV